MASALWIRMFFLVLQYVQIYFNVQFVHFFSKLIGKGGALVACSAAELRSSAV